MIEGVTLPEPGFQVHRQVPIARQRHKGGTHAGEGLLLPMAAISWASLAPFRLDEDCTVPRNWAQSVARLCAYVWHWAAQTTKLSTAQYSKQDMPIHTVQQRLPSCHCCKYASILLCISIPALSSHHSDGPQLASHTAP